jgi:hypothetical protein
VREPCVIWGLGELGTVFASGLLRRGRTVTPVLRETNVGALSAIVPELVLVTVREDDLDPVLARMPSGWRGAVGLVQNELRPDQWLSRAVERPTVAVVWFEKKPGTVATPLRSTPIAGPRARLLVDALAALDLPANEIAEADLDHALAVKNLYILATNLAGLAIPSSRPLTTGDLAREHRAAFEPILRELFEIERALHPVEERALDDVMAALSLDPAHKAMGRTAHERLERTLRIASERRIDAPLLRAIPREE